MKNIIHILIFLLHSSISYVQIYTYQLSSYILDICKRISASDFSITLHKMNKDKSWTIISTNITDINGRVTNLLPYTKMNNDGIYKQTFEIYPYFRKRKVDCFYPFIDVFFSIKGHEHFHVPMTISAFGYSTYIGN